MFRLHESPRFLVMFFALAGLALLSSCATMNDVIRDKEDGTVVTYPVTQEQAWDIARTVLRWEGCETIEEHRERNYMLTTAWNMFTAGTYVGVWVEPAGDAAAKVTVVTKRKVATNLVTALEEPTFHASFARAVEIVRNGDPLPLEKPEP